MKLQEKQSYYYKMCVYYDKDSNQHKYYYVELQNVRAELSKLSIKLNTAIKEVEGNRVKVRKITAADILDDINHIEKYLNITKKSLNGTKVMINHHAQKFPTAYKGIPESTYIYAEFTNNTWYITDIIRYRCGNKKFSLNLSESAKTEYLNNAAELK